MDCVVYVDTSDPVRGANEVCQLIENSMARARREVRLVPRLYKSGVRYARQNPSACELRQPLDVFKRKGGDCKQLTLWRIAELRELDGEHATPRIIWLNEAVGLVAHALVRRADGSLEDPSLLLGMPDL